MLRPLTLYHAVRLRFQNIHTAGAPDSGSGPEFTGGINWSMNFVDIILILIIALAVIFALRAVLRRNKKGGCGCGCGGCAFSDECGDSSLKK